MASRAWKRNVQSLITNCTLIDVNFIVTASGSVAIPANFSGSGQLPNGGISLPQSVTGGSTGVAVNALSFGGEVQNITNPASGVYVVTLNSAYPAFKTLQVETFGTLATLPTGTGSVTEQVVSVSGFNSNTGNGTGTVTLLTSALGSAGVLAQPYCGMQFSMLIVAKNSSSNTVG